ncbi:MAG: hypothetical protein QFX35_06240 [Candidatus Verstraetearchaeota archaeon]|nr:hypothetical protein [Candidatus Verstraetearchaeota archaeon]
MEDVYELAPSMRLLIAMHNTSSIDPATAKSLEELKLASGIPDQEIRRAIDELMTYGYVECRGTTYYLSRLGICVIRSVYT